MAILMPYQTDDGVDHPESYWRIVFVRLDVDAMEAFVSFSGYHNATARADKKRIIGRKEYMVTGQEFLTYFGIPALSGQGNPLGNTYLLARATKDTLAAVQPPPPPALMMVCTPTYALVGDTNTPIEPLPTPTPLGPVLIFQPQPQPVYVSFFDAGTNV